MAGKEVQSSNILHIDCSDWVSIGDLFSDESSFHGDGQIKTDLERRATSYDPKDYWNIQAWNLQCLAAIAAAKLPPRGMKRKQDNSNGENGTGTSPGSETNTKEQSLEAIPNLASTSERPYNPYEGHKLAKQLSQSLEDFLVQFPPSTTSASSDHWIRIANPVSNFRPLNQDIAAFQKAAQDPMDSYLSAKASLERNAAANPASITRKLKPDRDNLERTILSLAKQYRVVTGKWMLFPSTDTVDEIWRSVAQKTLDGILGSAAKVAIQNEGEDNLRNDQRLLCVYTEDFNDTAEIKRVLRELHRSRLVVDQRNGTKAGVIYYKCDAYTHLDIVHGNEFKIKASLYNSKDLFAEMRRNGELQ